MSKGLTVLLAFCMAGCTVTEQTYPATWNALEMPADDRCFALEGEYSDRGERTDEPSQPSLTRQLFGEHAPWEEATRVQLAMPEANSLQITVWGRQERLSSVVLHGDEGEFTCDRGTLEVRSKRWIFGYILSGRQHMSVRASKSGGYLVTEVDESAYGLIFIIWPIAGEAKHWYRFPRL